MHPKAFPLQPAPSGAAPNPKPPRDHHRALFRFSISLPYGYPHISVAFTITVSSGAGVTPAPPSPSQTLPATGKHTTAGGFGSPSRSAKLGSRWENHPRPSNPKMCGGSVRQLVYRSMLTSQKGSDTIFPAFGGDGLGDHFIQS